MNLEALLSTYREAFLLWRAIDLTLILPLDDYVGVLDEIGHRLRPCPLSHQRGPWGLKR